MLATIAALQLAVLSQVGPPPREVTADEVAAQEADPAGAPAANPPLPRRGEPADPGAPPAASEAFPADPAARALPPRRRQLSLVSAEPLGGASTALVWAGWSSLGIAYAQGITEQDDLGGFASFDWQRTEFRLGALYRRPLGTAGVFDMAGRLALAWYENFGSTWIHDENHSDRGVELVPGLALSTRAASGVFSMLAEAPLTVTTKYGSGFLFSPRFSLAYEAPVYPDLAVGAQLGVGYRAGSGDAPLRDGQADLIFLLLATYQLL